ncbi:MAG TPA: M24 family metallopeptidase [Xylella sp.]
MSIQIGHLTLEQARAQLTPWMPCAPAITVDEYAQRIEHARGLMRTQGVDALLVGAGASLRYFTGIPWKASERLVALLIFLSGDPLLICPAFEEGSLDAVLLLPAEKRLWDEHEDPYALVAQTMTEYGAYTLALDPSAVFAVHTGLCSHLNARAIIDATSIVDGCRLCKSPAELALIQQACDMTLQVQRLAAGIAHEGIGTDALVRFIDEAHRMLGADNGSTFCIVQFGYATSFPHGIPSVQHLLEGELVLIDTGCTVQGYHSDITRTWIYGTPGDHQREIWDLEHAAQAAAFDTVRPGVTCEAVDMAARKVLELGGLGPGYRLPGLPHRTGHGCGLAIHEAPYLVQGNHTVLRPSMCASDEPMIVVPGHFGIRLEDHFYVTEDGAQWFTSPSPEIDRPFA